MKFSMKAVMLATVSAGLIFPLAPAMASDAEEAAAEEGNVASADDRAIIVSARRRAESILKVPVVASVFDSEALVQTGASDLVAISSRTPGLQIGSAVAAFGNQVALRGIGTTTNNSAIDQSVSLNIDGMQFSQGLSYALGFFDMQQVEVLKGPQALFFGKASPAGVISIRSVDPGYDFEVSGRAGYEFEAREYKGELAVSVPLSENLRMRLAGSYAEGDGFFHHVGRPGDLGTLASLNPLLAPFAAAYGPLGSLGGATTNYNRVPATENLMLRGTVLFDPTDTLSVRLKVNHGDTRMEGPGFDVHLASCPDGTAPANAAGVRFVSATDDCKMDRNTAVIALDPAAFPGIYNGGVPFGHIKQTFGTLEMNFQATPELTVSSLTGYLDLKQRFMTNGGASSFAGSAFVVQGGYDRKDFTQELRLTSDYSGPFNFMLGGFLQDTKQHGLVSLPANQRLGELLGFLSGLRGGNATAACNMPALMANPHGCSVFPGNLSEGLHTMNTKAYSLFGQVLYKLQPNLELGLGARWTDETRRHQERITFPPLGLIPLAVPKISSANVSPEISLTYTPTDNLTVFGTLKQAYKSGSYIFSGLFNPGQNASFGDERVRGGELGIKSVLAGGDLNVNLAGYYYKYKDLQVGMNEISAAGNYIIYTRNAAGAKSYGVDFDMQYQPSSVPGLKLSGAATWNISKFTNFVNAPCWGGQTVAMGCNLDPDASANGGKGGYVSQDLSGSPLVRAPKWQLSGNMDYEIPLKGGMSVLLGSGVQYSSRFLTNSAGRADMYQPGYVKLDLNVALRGEEGKWELAMIGNNLNNKIIRGNCSNGNYADSTSRMQAVITGRGDARFPTIANPAGVEELICAPTPGRSLTVRASFKF
jgi:outer membrane receptor protein involved in Fe transport